MLPIKTRFIFKSRWIALLWAGGILWTAVDFAGDQPQGPASANGQANADTTGAQSVVNALGVTG
jgi:hypothetical protein